MGLPIPTHPWIVSTDSPAFVLDYPESPSVDEVRAFLQEYEKFWLAVDQPIVLVSDLSNLLRADAQIRRMMSDADNRLRHFGERWLRAWGIVVKSGLQRMLLTGYLWFATPVCEYKIWPTRDAALEWVKTRL